MRPIFFTLLFLSSFAFAQEINQEEVEVKSVEDASAINDSVNDPALLKLKSLHSKMFLPI